MNPMQQAFRNLFVFPNASERYGAIDGLRAYAAFQIFLVHFSANYMLRFYRVSIGSLPDRPDLSHLNWLSYLHHSHYGVDFFFLISGFLITAVVSKSEFKIFSYVGRRMLRIYPAFLAAFSLYLLHNYYWDPITTRRVLMNLLFLNGAYGFVEVKGYMSVTWSLFYEFFYYLTFPIVVLFWKLPGNRTLLYCLYWGLFAIVLWWLAPHYNRMVMFFLGGMVALHKDTVSLWVQKIPDSAALVVFLGATTLYTVLKMNINYYVFVMALPMVLFFCVTTFGSGFLNRIFRSRALQVFGAFSYSFFLVHDICIQFVMLRIGPWRVAGDGINALLTFSVSLVLAIGLAFIIYVGFERWYYSVTSWSKSRKH